MQKACGIIAIGAIVLSTSQFASAQTSPPDQPSQLSDKPALRDQVKIALRQAGFKNIRIISESFLVRALDQNGDRVIMVVRPDSLRTVRAPSEADNGEANADEPGYPEQWGDLSESEGQGTIRTPQSGYIGKRSPAIESNQQAQGEQNAGKGSSTEAPNDTAKSAKMTDQDKNSGAAERAEENQTPSQSAKMANERPQTSRNEKVAGRPNGTATELNRNYEANLTPTQKQDIWRSLSHGNIAIQYGPANFRPQVGSIVPADVGIQSLPSDVTTQVPALKGYDYVMLENEAAIVNPQSKKVVDIIKQE